MRRSKQKERKEEKAKLDTEKKKQSIKKRVEEILEVCIQKGTDLKTCVNAALKQLIIHERTKGNQAMPTLKGAKLKKILCERAPAVNDRSSPLNSLE